MKKTNEQVLKFVRRVINHHGLGTEKLATAFKKYWINNVLNKKQYEFLNDVERELSGPSSFTNVYLDFGNPIQKKTNKFTKKDNLKMKTKTKTRMTLVLKDIENVIVNQVLKDIGKISKRSSKEDIHEQVSESVEYILSEMEDMGSMADYLGYDTEYLRVILSLLKNLMSEDTIIRKVKLKLKNKK